MIDILIKSESRYPISRGLIKEFIERVLIQKNVHGKIEVSVNIVGDRMMCALNKKYRDLDETTDVLSFPLSETTKDARFVDPPDNVLRLGDIVVSYPQAVSDAAVENKMVDQKVGELVEHGLLHLLGVHHE